MTRFVFLLALAALCGLSVYHAEVRLLAAPPAAPSLGAVAGDAPWPRTRPATADARRLHVVNWRGKEDLKTFMRAYFDSENLLCRHVLDHGARSNATAPTNYLLNVSFGCRALFETAGLGSGNFMAGLYAMRLAARALTAAGGHRVRVGVQCEDAVDEQARLILPWLMGEFDYGSNGATDRPNEHSDAAEAISRRLYTAPEALLEEACKNIDQAPIGLLFEEMQYELRRMAVRLAGVPPSDHAMHAAVKHWIEEHGGNPPLHNRYTLPFDAGETPLCSNVSLDDAVLHFRCGDLMDSNHPRFGFLRFRAFADRVPATARSIGIVTQPFDGDSDTVRALDAGASKRRRCRVVVNDFMSYLRQRFPQARVRLHNAPDETIALTYARLILAQTTVAAISTFGVFASIASFGTGYIRRPDARSATNEWLVHPQPLDAIIAEHEQACGHEAHHESPQLVLMDEPDVLMVRQVKKLWLEDDGDEKILRWFRGDE